MFWDGAKRYEKTVAVGRTFGGNGSGLYTVESTHPIFIGAYDETGLYQGNHLIDNLRISKGAARYTDAFTPPTSPVS